RAAEAAAGPDARRAVLFTGASSRRNIDLYQSEGYELVASAPDGTVNLVKDLSGVSGLSPERAAG
ncbi:hypothetical protein AB0J52_28715, partial [Spirillospora sp. NPDC049652]